MSSPVSIYCEAYMYSNNNAIEDSNRRVFRQQMSSLGHTSFSMMGHLAVGVAGARRRVPLPRVE